MQSNNQANQSVSGYKHSEVGVSNWKTELLGNVATLQRGFDLPHRLRKPGSIPIVTSSGFENTHCEAKVRGPGVVTGRYGTIGEVFYVQDDFWPLNTTLYVRDFHGNDPLFISYLLRTIDFHTHSGKSGVPGVNRNDLHEISVSLPPTLAEQHAIAEVLGDADALIESLEQLIAKKRAVKQGVMQELLTGKTRLPGFSGEWEVRRLGDVATFHKGKGLPKSVLDPFGIQPCIHYGELFTQYSETIREVLSRTNKLEDGFCSVANDVLMPTSDVTPNGLAKASCVRTSGILLGGDILVIRSNANQVFGSFLSYVIRHAQDQILQLVTGTTVFHLYATDMKKFTFAMPLVKEQQAIIAVLDDMGEEIAVLEAKLTKTRQVKQGMMHELLTGRIRLV